MANVNKVILVGRLTRDPEVRTFGNGGKVAKFGFAVSERKKNQQTTNRIFKLASTTTYQFSTGQRRDVYSDRDEDLYRAFYGLIEFGEEESASDMILLRIEGRHRTAFIRKGALDYISIPTHKYEAGSVEAEANEMEGMDI